jgi:hypothetical protein
MSRRYCLKQRIACKGVSLPGDDAAHKTTNGGSVSEQACRMVLSSWAGPTITSRVFHTVESAASRFAVVCCLTCEPGLHGLTRAAPPAQQHACRGAAAGLTRQPLAPAPQRQHSSAGDTGAVACMGAVPQDLPALKHDCKALFACMPDISTPSIVHACHLLLSSARCSKARHSAP